MLDSWTITLKQYLCFRVLQPPGGGSSNIFGGSDESVSRPATKNQPQTSLFGSEPQPQSSPSSKKQPATKDRLFGAEARKAPPSQKEDTMGHVFGGDAKPAEPKQTSRKGQGEDLILNF